MLYADARAVLYAISRELVGCVPAHYVNAAVYTVGQSEIGGVPVHYARLVVRGSGFENGESSEGGGGGGRPIDYAPVGREWTN